MLADDLHPNKPGYSSLQPKFFRFNPHATPLIRHKRLVSGPWYSRNICQISSVLSGAFGSSLLHEPPSNKAIPGY
jgi:hypothetical protein